MADQIIKAEGTIITTSPRRGRAPGRISLQIGSEAHEIGSYDGNLLQLANANIGKVCNIKYTIKRVEKNGETKEYANLVSLTVEEAPSTSPEGSVETVNAPTSHDLPVPAMGVLAIPEKGPIAPPRTAQAIDEITAMERRFELATRRYELLQKFIKEKFVKGIHYDDGSTFKSDKPALLQPGAYFIGQVYGYSLHPEIIDGPLQAPRDPNAHYTIVIKTVVKNSYGVDVGVAYGSCSSTIWSSRQNAYVGRAVDPDKSHNSTIKIGIKRSVVAAIRQTTDAASLFAEDIEEQGYGEEPPIGAKSEFIKRR